MAQPDDISQFSFIVDTITRGKVTMKNIERELICPACKELFTHPLILPCQHSVCHKCVKELLFLNFDDSASDVCSEASSPGSVRSRLQSPSIERIDRIDRLLRSASKRNSLTPRFTTLPCPGCVHEIDLGERGINGLFRNFTLETIVERYRQAASAATAIMCDLCKPPPQESTKSCMDCNASYCNECFKMHHPWGTVKAQHEYVGPTTNFRPKVLMCPEHEMEKVNMYCEICKRPVCHLCKLGGAHANHKVTTMSSAYKTLKEKLSKSIVYLISKESEVKNQISELEHLRKRTECNGNLAEGKANETFEKLFDVLEDRKSYVLNTIQSSKSSRLDKLHNQIEEYQGLLENNGLVGYAQEVLKETDQSCFVQTAKQLHERIQRATESLKSFRPSVNSSFEEFKVDVSLEKDLLGNISFSKAVDVPKINEELSKVYNEALICWQNPGKNLLADSYVLEYKRHSQDQEESWEGIEVLGTSKVVSDLETNNTYSFRVRGFKDAVGSLYSKEVTYNTPPAPVLSFLFDDKCGYNKERLILNKGRDLVESVAGTSLLLSAERIQVGSYMFLDYLIGDTGITKGRHFWAFSVESSSYLVKVGVTSDAKLQEWLHNPRDVSSPRYDQDSGHDSGSEDACEDISQPFALATIGMNRLFIPKAMNVFSDCEDRVIPMPSRIGICLEYEKGIIGFYDASRMKCFYERKIDCSGVMYPAFAMMGGGRIQLEQLIFMKRLEYPDEMQ